MEYLILDVSYLSWRNFHIFRSLSFEGESTGIAFGVFRDLINFRDLFEPDRIIFCFDAGSVGRKELLPTYKSSRLKNLTEDELEERMSVNRQIQNLRKYLYRIGFRNILSQPGYEADDVIASIVRESLTETDDAVIVSSDGDLLQLLQFNVVLYNPAKKRCVNEKFFIKERGIYPPQWADVKALAGCLSDDIKGILGIGEKTAAKWVNASLKQNSKKYKTISENLETYNKNILLTRLPFPGTKVFHLKDDKIDKDEWKKLMGEMGMSTVRNVKL